MIDVLVSTWEKSKALQRELAFSNVKSKVIPHGVEMRPGVSNIGLAISIAERYGDVKAMCPECKGLDTRYNAIHDLVPINDQFLYTCGDCNAQFGEVGKASEVPAGEAAQND